MPLANKLLLRNITIGPMPNSTCTPPVRLSQHSRQLWRSRLGSALRTSLACAIVGMATLYSPMSIRRHLHFPAFAYMTAVLTVGDASSLGNSIKCAACAFYGIVLGLLPAMLMFYLIRPEGVSATTTAVAVAISSFVVAASDLPGLITTRIALGQIVIVYVTAYKETGHVSPVVLHPVPVAASTALGAAAAVLALLFPYPRLAYCQVKEKTNLYTQMTKERLRVLVNAFCADNRLSKSASEYQAKSLAAACKKFLQNIKLLQGSVQWERPPFKFLPPPSYVPWERLEAIEIPLKGMEIALASITSASTKIVDQQVLKDDLVGVSNQISTKLQESNYFTAERGKTDKTFQSLHVIPKDLQCLPSLFFTFCIKLLDGGGMINALPNSGHDHKITPETEHTAKAFVEKDPSTKKTSLWAINISTERVVIALKCALSLGLAVFFGVLFSKDDGYWSGLTVAIAFTPCGEATFRLASVRAHGTALGSVYGVLGSFISQNLSEVRLLSLLPWVVFTSFLKRSRMYGPVGSLAATISAMIILGRRNYGLPMIFAINRLTETYIGLCCSIFIELLLQPARASTLARNELSSSLHMISEWLGSMANPVESKEKEKQLRKSVNILKKCTGEAEAEPNFWFLPFSAASYSKLHESLAKMVDLILFLGQSMEHLVQVSHGSEIKETIKGDLDRFKKIIGTSVKFFEGIIQVKSLERPEIKELQNKTSSHDIELGICPCDHGALIADKEECEKIVASLLQHSREVMERLDENAGADMKEQLLLCLASIGFCIEGMMRETREMGDGILELIQRENPCCNINLYDITCKLKVLPA